MNRLHAGLSTWIIGSPHDARSKGGIELIFLGLQGGLGFVCASVDDFEDDPTQGDESSNHKNISSADSA